MPRVELPKFLTPGLILNGENEWLRMTIEMFSRHVFIAGGTGNGKTKLLEMLCRQFITHGVGLTYVSPHPDAREAILQYCCVMGIDPRRIIDVKPGPDCCVGIDPFARPPTGSPFEQEAWLRATVGRTVSNILRNVPLAEQEVMNRLKRWLKNVLYCCGKDVDGEHLGINNALMLLDPNHPRFDVAIDGLWPGMPPEIRADYRNLRETKNPRQREQWVESTINRIRDLLDSPLVRQMFSPDNPAIDDEEIILKSKIQLVSVPESDFLTRDQGNVVAGLRISAVIGAAKRIADRTPEERRVPHMLIIDEAENFIGEDIQNGFQELRKFKLCLIFTVQDLSCLRKGE